MGILGVLQFLTVPRVAFASQRQAGDFARSHPQMLPKLQHCLVFGSDHWRKLSLPVLNNGRGRAIAEDDPVARVEGFPSESNLGKVAWGLLMRKGGLGFKVR